MALNIRNPEAEQLAAELAKQTGESKTEAVTKRCGIGSCGCGGNVQDAVWLMN